MRLVLGYVSQACEMICFPVQVQSTPTQFGGKHWWFTCPVITGDTPCARRVPPGARYFGCRHCHELTYQSCQASHRD